MGIFGRMRDITNANLNNLLDKAEDPEKMIKQIIREIEESVDATKRELAKVLAATKQVDKAVEGKTDSVEEWLGRAELAVKQGNDDLARKALENKLAHEHELETLRVQSDETHAAADRMKDTIGLLNDKLNEARARHTALAARASAAKTMAAAQRQASSLGDPAQALGKLEKFERRVEDSEAQAEALGKLAGIDNAVEREFRDMEKNLAVDEELSRLKAKCKQE